MPFRRCSDTSDSVPPRAQVSEGLAPNLRARERTGVSLWGVPAPALEGKEVSKVEDERRKKVTLWEAAEYLDLTPGKVQNMVERGVLKADKFAGAIHIPREEVERIERETAP